MKETPDCERASDLIAFLYNEADERERRDFQLHLNECSTCREEVASFGVVRESINAWRDEALAGFVSQPVTTKSNRKSALAALRQFFDLSPLWLKAATAFAVVVFGVLAAMAFVNLQRDKVQVSSTTTTPEATYTQQEVDHLIQQALLKGKSESQPQIHFDVVKLPKPKKPRNSADAQFAKSRRPLSKAEREQLAADLRLLSTDDDESLNLIGDRINQ
ncbi:MAG TPA: zf-HC2 domain-containing protein [Pyrinomonadaceae bacterium]|nr:zf-HC2 domain-containing protein [Pyrinomonadaceae bacterium]